MRVLHLNPHSDTRCKASLSSVFADVAMTRPLEPIFPNLRTLDLASHKLPEAYVSLFLHNTVANLSLSLDGPKKSVSPGQLINDVVEKAPNIKSLSLVCSRLTSVRSFEDTIGKLAQSLPNLSSLKLPPYFLTDAILGSLSESKSLSTLTFSESRHGSAHNAGDVLDAQSISPNLSELPFISLRHLCIAARLADVQAILNNKAFPGELLRGLLVRIIVPEPEANVRSFISFVSEKCESLESFHLHLAQPRQVRDAGGTLDHGIIWPPDAQHEPLTADTIQSIVNLPCLDRFTIIHPKPLIISDADADYFAEKMPDLKRLVLNPAPYSRNPTDVNPLTVLALIPFAKHCKNLRTLGLFVNGEAKLNYPAKVPCLFKTLRRLQIGSARFLPSEAPRQQVLKFLARVLPPGVQMKNALQVLHDAPSPPSVNPSWAWITERLPLVLEAREEERKLFVSNRVSKAIQTCEDVEDTNKGDEDEGRDSIDGEDSGCVDGDVTMMEEASFVNA